jgi:hypothetical protein
MTANNQTFSKDKYIAEVKAFCAKKHEGKEVKVLKTKNIIYFPCTDEGRQRWLLIKNIKEVLDIIPV